MALRFVRNTNIIRNLDAAQIAPATLRNKWQVVACNCGVCGHVYGCGVHGCRMVVFVAVVCAPVVLAERISGKVFDEQVEQIFQFFANLFTHFLHFFIGQRLRVDSGGHATHATEPNYTHALMVGYLSPEKVPRGKCELAGGKLTPLCFAQGDLPPRCRLEACKLSRLGCRRVGGEVGGREATIENGGTIASGTVLAPTISAPILAAIWISAGVS